MINKTNLFEFLEYLCEAVLITDASSNIVFANSSCAAMFGYSQQQMHNLDLSALIDTKEHDVHFEKVQTFIEQKGSPRQMMTRPVLSCVNAKGQALQARISISTLEVDGETYGLAILHDYSAVQKKLTTLESESNIDILTGLYNRRYLEHVLASDSRTLESWQKTGVMYLDLDQFKPINDCYGHDAGDNVLREISVRLRSALRFNDMLFRLGGDEFLVLIDLTGLANEKKVLSGISEKIHQYIAAPFMVKSKPVVIGASIGAGLHPQDKYSLIELVTLTDKAMYQAKSRHLPLVFVDDLN